MIGRRLNWGAGRIARAVRTGAVSSLSVVIVASLVAYAVAPSGEAIAARAYEQAASGGHEAIKGRVLREGKPAQGTMIQILKKTPRGTRPFASRKVGGSGRFTIPAPPGSYVVVIKVSGASKRIAVTVRRGHSIFVAAEVTHGPHGALIAPVVFNY